MPRPWRRRHLGTEADRATFRTLHSASLAAPALRTGLNRESAERSVRHLHALLGTPAVALTDTATALAWHGGGQHHEAQCAAFAVATVERGSTRVFDRDDIACPVAGCDIRTAIVSPLVAEELRSIERYLLLEQARFGDRLQVTLRIAPEVLPVAVPFLCIQPLVENAVRHGLESAEGGGSIRIVARDQDQECVIEVEDDGVGEDP